MLLLRQVFRAIGFDIVRYRKNEKALSRKTDRLKLHHTKTGDYYLPEDAHGDAIANTIINGGIFDREVLEVAKNYIVPGTTVLDVGANFGQMSILFSKLVGPGGKVYSFDADDFVFKILSMNIKANNLENVFPKFGAVHSKPGETLYFPEQDFKEYSTYGSYGIDYVGQKGRPVKTITIDELRIDTPISFMKVDIQGGDLQAMEGAVETIRRNRMPILFEYEYQFEDRLRMNFQDYVDFVRRIGYQFVKVINGQNYLIMPKE